MESLLEVAVGALLSKDNGGNNTASKKNDFEAVSGEWRLLQPVWDLRIGFEDYVSSPLFPIIVSISFYFICILPWMVFDLYGRHWNWIQKYKIQPKCEVTWEQVNRAMVLTFWNHLLYLLPISVAQWVWTPREVLPVLAPFLWEFCWHQFAALVVFDFEYFAWHAIHHRVRWLYRNVHALHHEYHSPSSWVTQYLHPWELISIGIFTTTSPWIFQAHFFTQISFMLLGILVSVEAHIGYDLPLMPHHWAPFWGGGIKHDMHHQRPRTNFQPFFTWWDRFLGTECPGQLAGGRRPNILEEYDIRKKAEVKRRRAEKKVD